MPRSAVLTQQKRREEGDGGQKVPAPFPPSESLSLVLPPASPPFHFRSQHSHQPPGPAQPRPARGISTGLCRGRRRLLRREEGSAEGALVDLAHRVARQPAAAAAGASARQEAEDGGHLVGGQAPLGPSLDRRNGFGPTTPIGPSLDRRRRRLVRVAARGGGGLEDDGGGDALAVNRVRQAENCRLQRLKCGRNRESE
jgi:hypothetical protein